MTLIADWMNSHAIDMDLAYSIGLRAEGDLLRCPYRTATNDIIMRTRRFPSGDWMQPRGVPLHCWWPLGRAYGANVLVTEGEGDTLAAASILSKDGDERLNGLCPVGIPGLAAVKACAAELAAAKTKLAYVCLDADDAGRKATERLCNLLHSVGVVPLVCELPDGYDLAQRLSELAVWSRADALSSLVSRAKPRDYIPPQKTTQAVRSDYTASNEGMGALKDIPAAVYVSRLAEVEEPAEGQLIHCPLHDDKTASFRVNKNLYHCFGCLSGGDIFSFAAALWECDDFKANKEKLQDAFSVERST
jgi:hypothetical protein